MRITNNHLAVLPVLSKGGGSTPKNPKNPKNPKLV